MVARAPSCRLYCLSAGSRVEGHYTDQNLAAAIFESPAAPGKDIDALTLQGPAPVDE